MNTTIKSLQDLYIKLGGQLTDTYEGIAYGIAVGDYTLIPDMIEAVKEKAGAGGGGESNPFTPLLMLSTELDTQSGYDEGPYYYINIRVSGQGGRGGMDNITADELHTQLVELSRNDNKAANWLAKVFYQQGIWMDDDALLAMVRAEASSKIELYSMLGEIVNGLEKNTAATIQITIVNRTAGDYLTPTSQALTQVYATKEEVGLLPTPMIISLVGDADIATASTLSPTIDYDVDDLVAYNGQLLAKVVCGANDVSETTYVPITKHVDESTETPAYSFYVTVPNGKNTVSFMTTSHASGDSLGNFGIIP